MRLKEYKLILEEVLELMNNYSTSADPTNSNYTIIENPENIVKATGLISTIKIFENDAAKIRSTNLFWPVNNVTKVNHNEESIIVASINNIKNNAQVLLNFLRLVLTNEDYSFSVKLPNNINSFESLQKISATLKKSFSLPVHALGGDVKFVDFDLGSLWIDIVTNSNEIFEFIKNVVKAGIFLYSAKINSERMEKYLMSLPKLGKEIQDKLRESNTEKLENEITEQTNLVIQKTIKSIRKHKKVDGSIEENIEENTTLFKLENVTNENTETIKTAIKEFTNALAMGVDVTPPLQIKDMESDAGKIGSDFPNTVKIDYNEIKELSENTLTEGKR